MRLIVTALTLTLLLAPAVLSQDSGGSEAAKKRAQEILKQAGEALGGEANLSALKSLQAQGKFKGVMMGRGVQGDFKIELLAPDKFVRNVTISMGPADMTSMEMINCDQTWAGIKSVMSMTAGGMGGRLAGGDWAGAGAGG